MANFAFVKVFHLRLFQHVALDSGEEHMRRVEF